MLDCHLVSAGWPRWVLQFKIIIVSCTIRIAPHWSRLCYSMTHCAAAVPSAQNGSAALGSASCNALCVCAPCHLAAALLPLQEVAEDASAASGKATSKVGNAMGQLDDEESTTHVTGLYTGVCERCVTEVCERCMT